MAYTNIEKILKKLRDSQGDRILINDKLRTDDGTITKWERQTGLVLPDDYRHFLIEIGECKLHTTPDKQSIYAAKIFDITILQPFEALLGETDAIIPASWFAIADLKGGNYVIMELSETSTNAVKILDGFREDVGFELEIISKSFGEFLKNAIDDERISSGGGSGRGFWSKGKPTYGNVQMKFRGDE